MVEAAGFAKWLEENTGYSSPVVRDTVSRIKRADGILSWSDNEAYQFYLEREDRYKSLSVSVRSQLKKAVKLYQAFRKRMGAAS